MSAHAKSLILKAQDHIDTAKLNLHDLKEHDVVGYNLAQAAEKYLKALCEMRGLEYPHDKDGHDLDLLMQVLEENNFTPISSHADVIELTAYNDPQNLIRREERLDLVEYLGHVESLKKLVGEELKYL
ncbi:MAG: HEPN domain-containing protein [Bdellovibrio sp.]